MSNAAPTTILAIHPIREARHRKGWTQLVLAQRAGVALRTVHSIEKWHSSGTGKKPHLNPRVDVRRRLLKALDVPFEQHIEMFPSQPKREWGSS